MSEFEKPNQEAEKELLLKKIASEMGERSEVYRGVDWHELPEEYIELYKQYFNNEIELDKLLQFINETNEDYNQKLNEYAREQGVELTPQVAEKFPLHAARSFFRGWIQEEQINKLKQEKTRKADLR